MTKNLIVCCDGTGNEIKQNLSNVLKLFRVASKNAEQRVYYGAGIGTLGTSDAWARWRQNAKAVFALATGYGLDADMLGAYTFLCHNYEDGDAIYLFGFSRGAYTVRAVAGMIHMLGLLPPDQTNIANYALRAYKQASQDEDFSIAWEFAKIAGARRVTIKFVGVWDTVASVLVPRKDRLVPQLLTLPYTRRNPSVEVFRHAMAIDERRRMFRLNRWLEPQPFVANPFDRRRAEVPQNIKQVWFAGVHADIGGGYPEAQSQLAKIPLEWMVREAIAHGVKINTAMRNFMVLGRPRLGSKQEFVRPNALAEAHNSMTCGWWPLEWIPKWTMWKEWQRQEMAGLYLPMAEPRRIADPVRPPVLHESVVERMAATGYRPENIPAAYDVEH